MQLGRGVGLAAAQERLLLLPKTQTREKKRRAMFHKAQGLHDN
jgi:hypothetical protein